MLHVLMARGVEGLEDFVATCGKLTGRCFEFQKKQWIILLNVAFVDKARV